LDYVLIKDGFIDLFTKPGLGVELDKQALKKAQKISHSWTNPVWRLADVSVAEW
jgi:galactonate dehydratase